MERALLVRHAESLFSARGLASGDVRARCPLTEHGVAQARALADKLAGEEIDVCVTTQLERTRQTADVALAGRAVARVVVPELNDPRYGRYEGRPLDDYIGWAFANDSATAPAGGGEARQAIVTRYAAGWRKVLERPERAVLVVTHSLPIAYILLALGGSDPAPRVPLVEYAEPHAVSAADLDGAVTRLEAWCTAPTW